jgi:hypothetical protein
MTRVNDLTRKRRHGVLGILAALPFTVMGNPADPAIGAETAHHAVTPLKDAPFVQDEDVKCLNSALENGNPDAGPSTFLLKAPPGCRYDIVWVTLNSHS